MLGYIDLIEPQRILYTKPIAIIYNPNSGKKRNIKSVIQARLDLANIHHEFLESRRVFETWELALNLDI